MNKFIKTGKKYDVEKIISELESINYAINSNNNLQTWRGDFDVFDPINKERTAKTHFEETDITECYYDIPYINSIIKENNLYRTRVMTLRSKECYSYHTDPTPRMHIPVTTNNNCMFIVDEEILRMESVGHLYWLDTRLKHLALNGSFEDRIHIVACV